MQRQILKLSGYKNVPPKRKKWLHMSEYRVEKMQ